MTQKAAIRVLISLAIEVIAIKTVMIEGFVVETIDVNWDDMHKKMALIKQSTIIL